MEYTDKVIERLRDPEKWPSFNRATHLSQLNGIADDAVLLPTEGSAVSAILIYTQLSEELLKILLDFSKFFIQAKLWPWKLEFKESRKYMFGRLIDELENTIEFENRDAIVLLSKSINEARIDMAHRLTSRNSLDDLGPLAIATRKNFDGLFSLYSEADEYFRHCLKDVRQTLEQYDETNHAYK